MKKTVIGIVLTLGLMSTAAFSQFGDMSLYTSLTTSGARMGGLYFDLGNGFATDVAVSRVNDETTGDLVNGYWIDICWGSWMAMIDGSTGVEPLLKFGYSVEGEVSETVTIGIYTDFITLQNGKSVQHFTSWDCYVKIPLKI